MLIANAHQINCPKSIGPNIELALLATGALLPASTFFDGVHTRCALAYGSENLTGVVAFKEAKNFAFVKNVSRIGDTVRAHLSYRV